MEEYTDLELNKMIAELEGLPFSVCERNQCVTLPNKYCNDNKCDFVYKPLTQKGRLFELMIKYKVEVRHAIKMVAIDYPGCKYEQISYESESEMPRAIIMCILTSENII